MTEILKSHKIPRLILDSLLRTTVVIVATNDRSAKALTLQKKGIIRQPVTRIIPNTKNPITKKTGKPDCTAINMANGEIVPAHFKNGLQKLRGAQYSLNRIIGSSAFIDIAYAQTDANALNCCFF